MRLLIPDRLCQKHGGGRKKYAAVFPETGFPEKKKEEKEKLASSAKKINGD